MNMQCKAFHEFMNWQLQRLITSIDEMKWYASEREHHDVGFDQAEAEFTERFLNACAADWRSEFCSNICPMRGECELKKVFIQEL